MAHIQKYRKKKTYLTTNQSEKDNPEEQWARDLNRHFIKGEIYVANKILKRF